MSRLQQVSRWMIRAGPSFYIAQDGTETAHKHLAANVSTSEAALTFAARMNIQIDGAKRYLDMEQFKVDKVRG